jgi:hypothetical protein
MIERLGTEAAEHKEHKANTERRCRWQTESE